MPLEAANYISDLDSTNPAATDQKKQGDDHIRLLKSCLLATLPGLTGPVTMTQAQLNTIPDLAPKASPVLTGSPVAPTPTAGDSTALIATTAFVTAAITAASGGGLSVKLLAKGRIIFYGG